MKNLNLKVNSHVRSRIGTYLSEMVENDLGLHFQICNNTRNPSYLITDFALLTLQTVKGICHEERKY